MLVTWSSASWRLGCGGIVDVVDLWRSMKVTIRWNGD